MKQNLAQYRTGRSSGRRAPAYRASSRRPLPRRRRALRRRAAIMASMRWWPPSLGSSPRLSLIWKRSCYFFRLRRCCCARWSFRWRRSSFRPFLHPSAWRGLSPEFAYTGASLTLNCSAVVLIGADRHRVGRDNRRIKLLSSRPTLNFPSPLCDQLSAQGFQVCVILAYDLLGFRF
jgi:hypothetical protein